ncbi:MAG: type II toxin-antitoxin system HicA family toxin [Acidobacteria bacterium]|nr:type II toxin-antitoxin system HicA family toxin [Acidobacteriota bacterium]
MGGRIRRMSAREVETLLRQYGFQLLSQKGSHRKWRHPARGLQVIVPEHGNRALPLGTLRNILVAAEIPEDEWQN